jgi:hypothetical protein
LNEFFDQAGNVFNNTLPMGLGTLIRDKNNFSTEYNMNDPEEYEKFILSLPKTKALLQSDDFFYDVQKYYNYIFLYRTSLREAKKKNDTLIELLKAEIK